MSDRYQVYLKAAAALLPTFASERVTEIIAPGAAEGGPETLETTKSAVGIPTFITVGVPMLLFSFCSMITFAGSTIAIRK